MCSNDNLTKIISVESQLEIKKIIFLKKYNNNNVNKGVSKNFLNNFKSGLENYENINNCNSLFVNCFDIKLVNQKDVIQPMKCIFSSLPENDLNPFQSFYKSNNLSQKRIIDIRKIKDTEEDPAFLFLNNNNIFSQ